MAHIYLLLSLFHEHMNKIFLFIIFEYILLDILLWSFRIYCTYVQCSSYINRVNLKDYDRNMFIYVWSCFDVFVHGRLDYVYAYEILALLIPSFSNIFDEDI